MNPIVKKAFVYYLIATIVNFVFVPLAAFALSYSGWMVLALSLLTAIADFLVIGVALGFISSMHGWIRFIWVLVSLAVALEIAVPMMIPLFGYAVILIVLWMVGRMNLMEDLLDKVEK